MRKPSVVLNAGRHLLLSHWHAYDECLECHDCIMLVAILREKKVKCGKGSYPRRHAVWHLFISVPICYEERSLSSHVVLGWKVAHSYPKVQNHSSPWESFFIAFPPNACPRYALQEICFFAPHILKKEYYTYSTDWGYGKSESRRTVFRGLGYTGRQQSHCSFQLCRKISHSSSVSSVFISFWGKVPIVFRWMRKEREVDGGQALGRIDEREEKPYTRLEDCTFGAPKPQNMLTRIVIPPGIYSLLTCNKI